MTNSVSFGVVPKGESNLRQRGIEVAKRFMSNVGHQAPQSSEVAKAVKTGDSEMDAILSAPSATQIRKMQFKSLKQDGNVFA